MRYLILFFFSSLVSAQTYLDPFQVSIEQMSNFLEEIRDIENLPKFERVTRVSELDPDWENKCSLVNDQEIMNIFSEIKDQFFNNISIPFYSCDWEFGTGTLLEDGIFFENLESINLNSSTSLAGFKFTVAHEIAHYTHEISALEIYSGKKDYSLNDYPSYTLSDVQECLELELELDQLICDRELWRRSHSEVDIYAALVLKNMGFDEWNNAKEGWLERLRSVEGVDLTNGSEQINLRFNRIKQALR